MFFSPVWPRGGGFGPPRDRRTDLRDELSEDHARHAVAEERSDNCSNAQTQQHRPHLWMLWSGLDTWT